MGMKKYKLLQELPGAQPGEIFIQTEKFFEHETKVIKFRSDFCRMTEKFNKFYEENGL